ACAATNVKGLICTGDGPYADPFDTTFCLSGNASVPQNELRRYQRAVANRCDAGENVPGCSDEVITFCLPDPYNFSPICKNFNIFDDVRASRLSLCGMAGSEVENNEKCTTAVRTCTGQFNANCGDIVSAYCFVEAGRNPSLCAGTINTACLNVNPFNPRCTDSVTDVYDTTRGEFCSSQSLDSLDTLGADLINDCRPHAVAICGYHVAYRALSGPRPRKADGTLGATRFPQQEIRVYGSNPYAAICSNSDANPGSTVQLSAEGDRTNTYNQIREGADTHAKEVLGYYVREFCPVIPSNNARIPSCPKIDRDGADGYEAWGVAVGAGNLVSAGDAALATSTTNFIAGYGGGLYLGVGNRNVANAKTFRLNAGANGFAYATTGTQLFTGLLSGTTNLGAPLG
ncbi:MAG: hypothetical protein K8953_04150, partial [Proteobacteria bacterium]|nr:hypothetical protein [Pseudomonadota bacterium]